MNKLVKALSLIDEIQLAASASRGIPDGDTVALEEIVKLIKQFKKSKLWELL